MKLPGFLCFLRKQRDHEVKGVGSRRKEPTRHTYQTKDIIPDPGQIAAGPDNPPHPKLSHSKSRTLIRVISTTFRPPTDTNAEPPPPPSGLASRENREAALRERGLLPPKPNKDLSRLERERDKLLPIVRPPSTHEILVGKGGIKKKVSAAMLIKQEWEARNGASNPIPEKPSPPLPPPPKLQHKESRSSVPKFSVFPKSLRRDRRSLPQFSRLEIDTTRRRSPSRTSTASYRISEHTSSPISATRLPPQIAPLVSRSPITTVDTTQPQGLSPPTPFDSSGGSTHMKINPSQAQDHPNKISTILESPHEDPDVQDSNLRPKDSFARLTTVGKTSTATERVLPDGSARPSPPDRPASRSRRPSNPAAFSAGRLGPADTSRTRKMMKGSLSLNDMRRSAGDRFARPKPLISDNVMECEISQPASNTALSVEQNKGPGSTRTLSTLLGVSPQQVDMITTSVGTRQAVSPPLYNRESIMLATSTIKDEESRRVTELAFLG